MRVPRESGVAYGWPVFEPSVRQLLQASCQLRKADIIDAVQSIIAMHKERAAGPFATFLGVWLQTLPLGAARAGQDCDRLIDHGARCATISLALNAGPTKAPTPSAGS